MVRMDRIQRGLQMYMDNDIVPQLPTIEGIAVGVISGMAIGRLEKIAANLPQSKAAKLIGIIDDSGAIDIDALREHLKKHVRRVGSVRVNLGDLIRSDGASDLMRMFDVRLSTITLTETDIDRIYEYVTGRTGAE